MGATSTIYVLHFEPAYAAPIGETGRVKTAGHYIGSTAGNVAERVALHEAGRGSPLVRAAIAAGSRVILAATLPGGRNEERRLKASHHRERWRPLCTRDPKTAVEAARS
jgi:hypothetical protein